MIQILIIYSEHLFFSLERKQRSCTLHFRYSFSEKGKKYRDGVPMIYYQRQVLNCG
jgi:hypothetical protein